MLKIILLSACMIFGLYSSASADFYKYGDPKCEKCKKGEYFQHVTDQVPNGSYVHSDDPPCKDQSIFVDKIATQISKKSGDARIDAATGGVVAAANRLGVGGTVGAILADYTNSDSSMCRAVCGLVPKGATVSATRIMLSNKDGGMERCEPGNPCAGWARVHHPDRRGRLICVVVSNWSHNLTRTVHLDYWYKNPKQQPIEYR